jgi:hypothetical protein
MLVGFIVVTFNALMAVTLCFVECDAVQLGG